MCRTTRRALGALLALTMSAFAQNPSELETARSLFEEGAVEIRAGDETRRYPWRLLRPEFPEPGRRYPVILFLHGAGERGTDNEKQLVHFPWKLTQTARRRDTPCFLLAPQCPEDERWVDADWSAPTSSPMKPMPTSVMQAAHRALEDLLRDPAVDHDRVYLTGLSMGGYGAWEMAARWPGLFAALAPVCGGGSEREAHRISHLPIWAFHGDADAAVPVERSRSMVTAVKRWGGKPLYTEVAGMGHASWVPAYSETALVPWMMAQRRARPEDDLSRALRTQKAKQGLRPGPPWSAVCIDCARHPQSIDTLRQVITLCRFFGIKILQLHLTDDEAFTFPSSEFPEIATPGRAYLRQDLIALDRFAREQGVLLVPEIDLPGHAKALVAARPDLFGLEDPARNPSLINLGSEKTLQAIETLLDELVAIFPEAPYVHLGGDEVDPAGIMEDPRCRETMRRNGFDTPAELQRWFLGRVHAMLAARGAFLVVWEGFPEAEKPPLPDDLMVTCWDAATPSPELLLDRGFRVINASWKPLYVVGGGTLTADAAPRLWSPGDILRFDRRRFDHWDPAKPSFGRLDVPEHENLIGAQLCLWEQMEWSVVPQLLPRLAAFARSLSHRRSGELPESTPSPFRDAQELALREVQGVVIHPPQPELLPAHDFDEDVVVSMAAWRPHEGVIRFTQDGSLPTKTSPVYEAPFVLTTSTTIRARLFDAEGQPRLGSTWAVYEKRPARRVLVSVFTSPPGGWSRLPDWDALTPQRHYAWHEIRGGLTLNPMGLVSRAQLVVPEAGEYRLRLAVGDALVRVEVDGHTVCLADAPAREGQVIAGKISLEAGEHALKLEYAQGPHSCRCRLEIIPPGEAEARPIEGFLELPR